MEDKSTSPNYSVADEAKLSDLAAKAAYQGSRFKEAAEHWQKSLYHYLLLHRSGQVQHLESIVTIRGNLGLALLRSGQSREAALQFEKAVSESQIHLEPAHYRFKALAARLRCNLAIAYADECHLANAQEQYETALSIYQELVSSGRGEFSSEMAITRGNFANALAQMGRLTAALWNQQTTVTELERLVEAGNSSLISDLATALGNLGNALTRSGRIAEALSRYQSALQLIIGMINAGQAAQCIDAARIRCNMGSALSDAGRLDEAIDEFLAANLAYESFVERDQPRCQVEAASVLNNLGIALSRSGRHDDSTVKFHAALMKLQPLLKSSDVQTLSYAARIRSNWGTALIGGGKLEEAIDKLKSTLTELLRIATPGNPGLLGNASRARSNLGNALSEAGHLSEAIKHYRDAMEEYRALIDTGQRQFRADAARTQGNLGLALSRIGDMAGAMAALDECAKAYQALVGEGQRQHILEWHRAVRQYAESALGWLLGSVVAEGVVVAEENPAQAARHHLEQAWLKLLQLEPAELDSHKLQSLEMMWKTLDEYWQARLRGEAALEQVQLPVVPVVLTWLDHAADLLSRGRPEYLAAQIDQLRPMLSGCLQMLLELGQPGAVATWHLRTQGLRAQRQVLASGAPSDPELGKLAAMLDEIDQLATILSGQHQAQSLMLPSVDGGIAMRMSALSGGLGDEGELKRQQALQARYNQLKQEADQLEALLASQGRLPKAQRMDLSLIEQGLRAGDRHDRALVLLLPHQAEQMIVCSIQADQDKPAGLHYGVHPTEAGASEVQLRQWVSQLTEAAVRDGRSVRSSLSDEELQAVAQVEPEPIAVEPLRQAWQQLPLVLRPLLARLYQQGVREVHIVPGGDWHLAPWAGTLDECEQDLRVRQYPTAASWWRVMTEPEEQPLTPSRWAALAHDAQHTRHKPLLWVPPELQALQTIWGPQQLQCLSPSEPVWPAQDQDGAQQEVHALVGLGHGGAPAGNWALAGMVIGQDADRRTRYFTALDLHRVRHATRVVMSCCVLGRVQDWIGEPMGLGALAFGLQARLAVGAVVPIADLEGSLLSMALHHAWQGEEQQCLARGQQMDWSGVFHATRRQILAGQWPQGFEQRLVQGFEQLRGPLRQALDEAANGTMPPRQYWANLARQPSPVVQHTAALTYCLG